MLKSLLFLLPSLVTARLAVNNEFLAYANIHGKSYRSSEELLKRQQIYQENDKIIKLHNSSNKLSELKHNFMSDMTAEERQSLHSYKTKERVISEMDENTNPRLKLAAQ